MKTDVDNAENQRDWIEKTLFNLRAGDGREEDVERLRELLKQDPKARQTYLRFHQLDSLLTQPDTESQLVTEMSHGEDDKVVQKSATLFAIPGFLIAGALGVLILFFTFSGRLFNQDDRDAGVELGSIASLTSDYQAQLSGEAKKENGEFGVGKVSLTQGIAQLTFQNGAQLVFEGKSGFEIVDEKHIILKFGKLWMYCPPEAEGFRVTTPGGKEVVDLGTEFGITVSGEAVTDIHVMDGLVEVADRKKPQDRLQVEEGEALSWSDSVEPREISFAGHEIFISAEDLSIKRIEAYQEELLSRSDVLLYYDFQKTGDGTQIPNLVPQASERSSGRCSDPIYVNGRVGKGGAMLFESKSNHVEFDLNLLKRSPSFTLATWVKMDRLSQSRAVLLNTIAQAPRAMHFQINRNGAVGYGLDETIFRSPSRVVQAGKWHLLAVTQNQETGEATLYCDGALLPAKPEPSRLLPHGVKLKNSHSRRYLVGYWGHKDETRVLNGRMDELMIFNGALSAEEHTELYEKGRP